MNFHPTFWLVGLAAFALPIGTTAGCHQSSTQSSAQPVSTTSPTVIRASAQTTGITITGVN